MNGTDPAHSPVFTEVAADVLAGLAVALGVERAVALVLDENGASCRAVASVGLTADQRERAARGLAIDADARAYWDRLRTVSGPIYVAAPNSDARRPWQGVADVPPHLAAPLLASDGALLGVVVLVMPPPHAADLHVAAKLARLAAIAIEQTRASVRRERELARTAVLLDIVREVDRPAELPEVLAAICRKTVEGFGSRQATVYFRSRRHRASLPLADYGTPAHVAARFVGGRYFEGNIPHEEEVRTGRTVVITRGSDRPEDHTLLDLVEIAMIVMVPLRDEEGAVHGTLTVGFDRHEAPGEAELRDLEMVARHATMAIIRARLLHWTEQSSSFRAAVSALAIELNAASGRSEVLRALCERGGELFGVDSGALLLATDGGLIAAATCGALAELEGLVPGGDPVVSHGPPAAGDAPVAGEAAGGAPGAADSPVARALRDRTVVLKNDRPRRDDAPPIDRLRSLLAIPLVERGGAIGVLVLGALRPRRFRPNVVAEAPLLGALAVGVLRNVALMGQLQETNRRLAQMSVVKDQFLANVSHDLRTPLNVIIGFGQLALEDTFGAPSDELRQILERMLGSARQQLALVQDLLDVSRLELNGLQVKPVPMAVEPLVAEMELLATNLIGHRPVRIVVDRVAPDAWIHADPDRVRQVLTNLVANAAKFTDQGTVAIRVAVEADAVRIDVADTGIGIAAGDLDGIFEPFRQVDGGRAGLGAGLGLAIARRLAVLMQGTLAVASELGVGSTFSLTLPNAALPTHADVPDAAAG
jgi:signal transduction histidine kinase